MKFLLRATIPVDVGNEMAKDTQHMGQLMETMMGDLQPEAAYFCLENGQRTLYFVVNVDATHDLPRFAEPLWQAFSADVEMIPAMSQEDFAKAGPIIEQTVKKY